MIVREFAENEKIKIYDMKYEIFNPFGQVLRNWIDWFWSQIWNPRKILHWFGMGHQGNFTVMQSGKP